MVLFINCKTINFIFFYEHICTCIKYMYIQWKTISAVRNSIGIDRSYFQLLFDFTSTLWEASGGYGDHWCVTSR